MTLDELIADHIADPEYDSAEVVRARSEELARAAGLQCRIHAVDLTATPPIVRVRITYAVRDEDEHCRQVQQVLGDAVRVEPYVWPLAKTFGGPARRDRFEN